MNEAVDANFDPRTERYTSHVLRNYLERLDERCQTDFGWNVLIPDYDCSLSLRPGNFPELVAIAYGADIARIRMQQIHGPVLSLLPIIAIRASKFEFDSPLVGDE